MEAGHRVGKCRSHGPVLPFSMMQGAHWIIMMNHHTLRSASCPITWLTADLQLEKQGLVIAHPETTTVADTHNRSLP